MKPSPGERGTDRRVWVRFLQSYPAAVEAGGKVEIRRAVPISKRTGKVRSLDFSRECLFHRLLRCGAPGFMQLASWPER